MGRAQIYYPANQLSEVQIAQPGEFIDIETLEPYEGPYVEANGQYIAGSNPRLGDPILKRVQDLAGEKFRRPISLEYYTLTRREFDNHYTPIDQQIEPTTEQYEDGEYIRYFVQKKNESHKIYEIDEEQYKEVNRQNDIGIDSRQYNIIELRWILRGKDAVQNNISNIQSIDNRFPGFAKYLDSPADYVKYVPSELRAYPDGVEISSNLPPAYGIPPNSNQNCLNCKFRHNNYCSKWVAQIRRNYWCAAWQYKPKPAERLVQANLYTAGGEYQLLDGTEYIGDYHIHPDKGAMIGAQHNTEPHDYLYPIDNSNGQTSY